jgi:hypothetical protein
LNEIKSISQALNNAYIHLRPYHPVHTGPYLLLIVFPFYFQCRIEQSFCTHYSNLIQLHLTINVFFVCKTYSYQRLGRQKFQS